METEYLIYTKDTKVEIDKLNNQLQNEIDSFYPFTFSGDKTIYTKLIDYIHDSIDSLNTIFNNYLNYIQNYFNNLDSLDNNEFIFSNNLKEFIYSQLDTFDILFMSVNNFNISNSYESLSEIIIRYANMNLIYDSILSEFAKMKINEDSCDIQIYDINNILSELSLISYNFDKYSETINLLINTNDINIMGIIQYYILELGIISCIIEFIESVKQI